MSEERKPNLPRIRLYALSTCSHCKTVKKYLEKREVAFEAIEVDLLEKEERKQVVQEVKEYNERATFPTTVIGDTVVVGDKKDQLRKAIDALQKEKGSEEQSA